MAVIDLNQCFPESREGLRGPLPKQNLFLSHLLSKDPLSPKFVAYVGGVGSGKTMIGCIATLTLAVTYPGDYLVSRLYYPELKDTTYKTFLEICPPELIVEHRVADMLIKIKSTGGTSTIFFRPLEEPDKLRSLNLNAFYIDEASQVSEAAFMLLQGRLRGRHVRKGYLTSNPAGHDWIYRWFFKKDHIQNESVKRLYTLIKAPSWENAHLPEGYIESMMNSWSKERIKREVEGSFDAFEGQVYDEFDRSVHVIKPFRIPDEWTRVIGADHGFRNAAAWVWGACDYDGNIYVYREFYEKEWLIEQICKLGKEGKPSVTALMGREKIESAWIDPSTRARRGGTGGSDFDIYLENLPGGFPLMLAKNDVSPGIERVKQYLKVDSRTGKPRLFIFDTCVNLIEEMAQYRWAELQPNQQGRTNDKEQPVKYNDHANDALRYLIMSRPETEKPQEDVVKKLGYNTLEASLYRELHDLRKGSRPKDPFGDT